MAIITVDTNKLLRNKIAPAQIKIIKDDCIADDKAKEDNRYFISDIDVQKILKVNNFNLANATKKGLFPVKRGQSGYKGYDIREILKYLWDSMHGTNIDLRIKKQKEIELTLRNKVALGEFVKKETAQDRTVSLINVIKKMFFYVIKASSAMLVGCSSARVAEKIISEQFKEIFNVLENEAKKVEWKSEKEVYFSEIDKAGIDEF